MAEYGQQQRGLLRQDVGDDEDQDEDDGETTKTTTATSEDLSLRATTSVHTRTSTRITKMTVIMMINQTSMIIDDGGGSMW